ncbi:NADPH-dependent FMN reductase [Nostoc sp. TCL26-01]|uniref:NADPH-dependent FMN reductase n=1 Tax=Nostoc sp. TCL26-01 TaxID=2576904 RepID=UPI0015C0190D|nr:NADPH-dependent FMN reductase [Nostoc sp. TCL26-01]QLE57694.1 NADPH-dependent FMN reductase [Nostoc sp. TCL26-01]
MTRILAIAGSPSHPSRTYSILEYTAKLLQQEGLHVDILSVRDLPAEDLVFGRYDSPALEKPKDLLAKADGVIIATPIYKAAYTGVLKTFLDLLPQKSLTGKIILPIATGGAIAHLLSVEYALKPILSELGGRHILATIYAVEKQIEKQADGSIRLDAEIEQRLHDVLQEFTKALRFSATSTQELVNAN